MRTLRALPLLLLVPILACLAGCPNGGSSTKSAQLQFDYFPAGVVTGWPNANIDGTAQLGSYGCNPGTDTNCITSFSASTNSTGGYTLQTDALPGFWNIAAQPDSNCTSGATWQGTLSTQQTIDCGEMTGTPYVDMTISPSYCQNQWYVDPNTRQRWAVRTCPTQLTITADSITFPTAYQLSVSNWSDTATQEWSGSYTASNSTTITIPFPTLASGDNVIVVRDPNTNVIIGAAIFDYETGTVYCGQGQAVSCP